MNDAFWTERQQISGTRLVRKLGQGGMAELWLGVEAKGGARVALKRLLPELVQEPEVQALFLDEMRVMSKLRHANIATVLDMGHQGRVPWLKLELLAGDPVSAIASRADAAKVSWPPALIASVLCAAAAALAYAHALKDAKGAGLQLVHRDVSPNNVFVCWNGAVKVLDFGIAWAAGRSARTGTGEFRGRLAYAPPEQVSGGQVDHRADQFSLGAVAFELLTRKRLHGKKRQLQVLDALTKGTEPFPRVDALSALVPGPLADVVARLLERDPARRFPSMAQVAHALERWLAESFDSASYDAEARSTFVHSLCAGRITEQAALYGEG